MGKQQRNAHTGEYIGRHRKRDDAPTVPQKIIRFINESYRVVNRDDHLFTHPTGPLYVSDLQEEGR